MKKQVNALLKSGIVPGVLAMLAIVLTLVLPGCQKEDQTLDDLTLKSAAVPELTLTYDEEVIAGEDFTIGFSSTCGRLMIERGYINGAPIIEDGLEVGYEKVYTGVDCNTELLQWEPIGDRELLPCIGGTITENWSDVGTYLYRAKLNQKAIRNSGCSDCADFKGNKTECFVVTVIESGSGTFTDNRDMHEYKWVKIGNQVWMAENLAYLPSVSDPSLGSYSEPHNYVFGNYGSDVTAAKATENYSTYGVLYNWPSAMKVCPEGWHLPSDAEWKHLEMTLNMDPVQVDELGYRGTDQATQMKSTIGWFNEGNGTNTSGFSGLPGGDRYINGDFYDFGYAAKYWSSTEHEIYSESAWSRDLYYHRGEVYRNYPSKDWGLSVRCVKN